MAAVKQQDPYVEVAQYLDYLKSCLKLHNWRIDLSRNPCSGDALAECEYPKDQRRAVISLSDQWWTEESPKVQVHVLLHELTHCQTAPLEWNAQGVRETMGYGGEFWYRAYNAQEELLVDDLAAVFSDLVEIPSKPFRK